ncbi:MAG: PDZ domain-containing protein, partial [Clostridia bacterium]|nr:PDZ domain-containing protein [Clostridia bacterium]
GFEIMEFPEGSPFLSVDAKIGDIITAIDGETVTSLTDITNVLARHTPGETIEISLYRYQNVSQPETVTVKITLLEDKGETQE